MFLCSICMSASAQKITVVVFDGKVRTSLTCCYPCAYPAMTLQYMSDGDYLCTGMAERINEDGQPIMVACMRARDHVGDHVAGDHVWVNTGTCGKNTAAGPCGLLPDHPKVCSGIEAMR